MGKVTVNITKNPVTFGELLSIVLIVLKVTGYIDLGWVWIWIIAIMLLFM